ncbi:uncharacterized protein LOC131927563 [Physella acuta]|uniref:uncharacterized protein LOC131927563 n=1 Tax=Physella acuta TaxID=109671 RepID=UPI0027DB1387|nr:uncharacterized protein LOC131927563 [Physella acuta]
MFGFFIAVCVCGLHVSMASPVEDRNDYATSIVLMEDGAIGGASMPDLLPFGLHLKGERLVLRLHRLETLQALTSQSPQDDRTAQDILNAAVYNDASLSAVMRVKRFAGRFYLDGTFTYGGLVWEVKSLQENRHQAMVDNSVNQTDRDDNSVKHRIFVPSWMKSPLNFRGDKLNLSTGQPEDSSHKNSSRNVFPPHEAQHTRHRRGVTQHVVEIAFVVDYADYLKWEMSHGAANALSEMRLWYTYVAETINMRYVSIQDTDFNIRTTISVLKILTVSYIFDALS